MQNKSDWKDATCVCAEDMEMKCREAIGLNASIIIVPNMENGTFVIANVALPKFVETMNLAIAKAGDK